MSVHKMYSGAGYEYLLRHTATGDAPAPNCELSTYYLESGLPPGVWVGSGLAGLNDGRGLPAGTPVDEVTLGRLFGHGHDPVTGAPLGRGLQTKRQPDGTLAVNGVSGFDLTFTVPKSASVLWALAGPEVQAQIEQAHHAMITFVLDSFEAEVLLTRAAHGGTVPLRTRGLVAARFDHFDSRAGDPNLHSHVVVANRVQGEDGRWRSIDANTIYDATVALSELYDVLVADELTRRLGVDWIEVDRGPGRNPDFIIDGIDPELLATFSKRSQGIAELADARIAEFVAERGRPPTGPEVTRIRQAATLATRPPKTVRSLAQLQAGWRAEAAASTGTTGVALLEATTQDRAQEPLALLEPQQVAELAAATIVGEQQRRSTWTRLNLLAEAARVTRRLRMRSPDERRLALEDVVDEAATDLVALHDVAALHPARAWTARWTSPAVLDAEQTLLDATTMPGPALPEQQTAQLLAAAGTPAAERRGLPALTDDQATAVLLVLCDSGMLQVLDGPAGAGKTTTLRAVTALWRIKFGPSSVVGLAPSASAAATLAASLGVPCENTAKWLHETDGPSGQRRAERLAQLTGRRGPADRQAVARLAADQQPWVLPRCGLLIVDEASLADTHTLAALTRQAKTAGAKILLVGDAHQGGAVGAGGGFGLLTRHTRHARLATLHRFTDPWEADATLRLRDGHADALTAYAKHGRLHKAPAGTIPDGERDAVLDDAHHAWADAVRHGREALLLATDAGTVRELNLRARTSLVLHGDVSSVGVELRDGTTAGVGDHLRARRNDRGITDDQRSWVRNGDPLTVTAVHPDGSLTAARRDNADDAQVTVRLPAGYVAEHVELGYALTVHRAQGLTVDEAHLVVSPGCTREALYVGMTRGRHANHAWVSTTRPGDHETHQHGPPLTAEQVLHDARMTSGVEPNAVEQLAELTRRVTNSKQPQTPASTLTADHRIPSHPGQHGPTLHR